MSLRSPPCQERKLSCKLEKIRLWQLRWERIWFMQIHSLVEWFGWKGPPEVAQSNPSSQSRDSSIRLLLGQSSREDLQGRWYSLWWVPFREKSLPWYPGNAPWCMYLISAVPVHIPEESDSFITEPFLTAAEGSRRQPKELSFALSSPSWSKASDMPCSSSPLSQWPPLDSLHRVSMCLVLPWGGLIRHRANFVSCSVSHWCWI